MKVDTVSLEQAPQVVRSACGWLEAATGACIFRPKEAHFNEVLSLAYSTLGTCPLSGFSASSFAMLSCSGRRQDECEAWLDVQDPVLLN